MITTINNNERIFLLNGDMGQTLICNLKDLEKCVNEYSDKDGLKIQHKWNGRFVRCSKKSIIDMLKGMNLPYEFMKQL